MWFLKNDYTRFVDLMGVMVDADRFANRVVVVT
jgi:hypothetical protein